MISFISLMFLRHFERKITNGNFRCMESEVVLKQRIFTLSEVSGPLGGQR